MTAPAPTITVWFDLPYDGGDWFTLDDTTKGLLDSATYLLAGDVGTRIDADAYHVSTQRGRSRELDEFDAGTLSVQLRNMDRTYDPLGTTYLLDEEGTPILTENGEYIIVEGQVFAPEIVPGKRVRVDVHGQSIFDGTIEDWSVQYTADRDTDAGFVATDALGVLARKEFDAWTTTAGQAEGARITAVLNRPEIDSGYGRDLDTGQATLQADSVTWGSNVLNYLQLVAESGAGRLFASRTNMLTYRDRHSTIGAAATLAFTDDGTGLPIHSAEIEIGAELLYNRVGIDREGGTLQTASDATSQDAYGIRTLNKSGLLMDSDGQSASMAEWLLYQYKDPTQRVARLTVNLSDDTMSDADRAAVCRAEIGDAVSVAFTPLGVGAQIVGDYAVEGVEHDLSYAGPHLVTLSLSPLSQFGAVFILDDATSGVLDTGVLAY